jgi:23S rRNA (guanosine2251-2'-O)-methyltransferase
MNEFDLIIGIHSIKAALLNPARIHQKVVATADGLADFLQNSSLRKESLGSIKIELVKAHDLQDVAKRNFDKLGFEYHRITSQIFLITSPLPPLDVNWLSLELKSKSNLKLFCLDQVTDVHNGAAILRTAAFYGVHSLILPGKNSFGLSPSFYRLASGGTEYVNIVRCVSLPKLISQLQEKGVVCTGFSEHAKLKAQEMGSIEGHHCLIMGAEDKGLSHAVERLLDKTVSLEALGQIKSLNVSVASAIAMDRFFAAR